MTDLMTDRADPEKLVRYLVTSLVDNPDDVKIEVKREEDSVLFEITLNPDDVGKVIGRQGRVIKAIRTLVRAAASVDGGHADVEILG
jgi:predicted RNA-binding protein YlqC (UPF0109 family)